MKYVLIYLFSSSFLYLSAQICGTTASTLELLADQYLQQKTNTNIESRNELAFIPITFHLVATDDGIGRVRESRVLDQLCQLNIDFVDYGIQFYLKKMNYIDNTTVYNSHREEEQLLIQERDNASLNIFILQDASSSNEVDNGRTLGYFNPQRDWLVMRRDQINDKSIVLTHEVGHFLGLLHPYNGWDFEPWSALMHGNPAPSRSPRGIATELMDRSNCDRSGDFLCDTPPDYFFAFDSEDCDYQGGARDPDSVLVDPDELNYMANFLQECDREAYYFSTEQTAIMQNNIASPQRTYLRTDFSPQTLKEEESVSLNFPNDDETIPTFNLVPLEWSTVEGATQYLVEIDRVRSFNIETTRILTDQNFLEVSNLDARRLYYWRVRPFNAYNTCADFSAPSTFRTGLEVDTTQSLLIQDWTLSPNPIDQTQQLIINITTQRQFSVEVHLFDALGRLMFNRNYFVSPNDSDLFLDISNLATGTYFVSIRTEEGRLTRKVIVSD